MAALNDTLLKKTNSHKLVFLGDSAVGKSCIVSRFVRKDFSEFQEPTIATRVPPRLCYRSVGGGGSALWPNVPWLGGCKVSTR